MVGCLIRIHGEEEKPVPCFYVELRLYFITSSFRLTDSMASIHSFLKYTEFNFILEDFQSKKPLDYNSPLFCLRGTGRGVPLPRLG